MKTTIYLLALGIFMCVWVQGACFAADVDLGNPGENIDLSTAKTMLFSEDDGQYGDAVGSFYFHYQQGSDKEKKEIASFVFQLLKQPLKKPEDWGSLKTPPAIGCSLAECLKLTEAIPLIVPLLKEPPGHGPDPNKSFSTWDLLPETPEGHSIGWAYRALVNMGSIAKGPLKTEMEKTKDKETASIIKHLIRDIERHEKDDEEMSKAIEKSQKNKKQ